MADGQAMGQSGQDSGILIPHFSVPPLNVELPLTIVFSKYKIPFSASTVMANGKPVATYWPAAAPPLFCNFPCALPGIGINDIDTFDCTVRVGMTPGDFVTGWIMVGVEMAFDLFFNWIGEKTFLGKARPTNPKPLPLLLNKGKDLAAEVQLLLVGATAKEALRREGRNLIVKGSGKHAAEESVSIARWIFQQTVGGGAKKFVEDAYKQVLGVPIKGKVSVPVVGVGVEIPGLVDYAPGAGGAKKLGAIKDSTPAAKDSHLTQGAHVAN